MRMDRSEWVRERRKINEERMDKLFAPVYDAKWGGYIHPTHQAMLERFLAACPPHGLLLDAACGTGKYWSLILNTGRRVAGIDHSQQMLNIAHAKHPGVPVRKVGLVDLNDQAVYDGILCIDSMELVFPEDWLLVLTNFLRALQPHGLLYLTVELESPEVVAVALQEGRRQGLPLLEGEVVQEGGYHYYPSLAQVHAWLDQAQFSLVGITEGDDYYHVIARAR